MPKTTPSMAKNAIRRALTTILSPEPTKKEFAGMWDYFGSSCAYCGKHIGRYSREGHNDHINPSGNNHISNRVLSCGQCNGDDKRERDWEQFLREKCLSEKEFIERRNKICAWVNKHKDTNNIVVDRKLLELAISKVHQSFDEAVKTLRDSKE